MQTLSSCRAFYQHECIQSTLSIIIGCVVYIGFEQGVRSVLSTCMHPVHTEYKYRLSSIQGVQSVLSTCMHPVHTEYKYRLSSIQGLQSILST